MRRGKEDPLRAGERQGEPTKARGNKPLVWCHAASVGESLSLLALVKKILNDYPHCQVMVTTGTVTSARLMAERLPGAGAFHQYIPVDHPSWTESFLNHWRPDLVIWVESELWPNLLAGIRRRKIPAVLVNARMSEKTFRYWRLIKGMAREILQTFDLCLAQNQAEAERLRQLGARNVKVSGNLKYAAAALPCDFAQLAALENALGARPRLVWASTHPGEEDIACRIHRELQPLAPQLLTIVVPRHPQRGRDIAALAGKAGLKTGLRSEGDLPDAECGFYIADTLGETGLFYRLSPLCILGGSFVPVGGHNPIEPAQAGCQIFYGPHMFNFVSICDDFESRHAALRVTDAAMLREQLTLALQNPAQFGAMALTARNWTGQQAHVVDDIAFDIAPFLRKASGAAA